MRLLRDAGGPSLKRMKYLTAPVGDGSEVRPLALGYVREQGTPLGEAELALSRRMLAQFAEQEGYTLGTVYVERIEQTPAAFEALVASAIRDEAAAVIVPYASHLWLIGSAIDMATQVGIRTGARVLEARQEAPNAPGAEGGLPASRQGLAARLQPGESR